MARSRNTADTQTASGGPVSPNIAGKNAIINGGMDVWQRGTSFTVANNVYLMDRWVNTGDANLTVTRDTDVPTSPYFKYSAKLVGTGTQSIAQRIESAESTKLAGQVVTISLYAKKTSGTGALGINIYYPSATDNFASVTQIGSALEMSANPGSSWARYSVTTSALPADVQKGLMVLINNTNTHTIFVTGVQVELGSSATPFSRAGGTIQGELAACQRYYEKYSGTPVAIGTFYDATRFINVYAYKVTKRTTPTLGFGAGNTYTVTHGATSRTGSSISAPDIGTDFSRIDVVTATSGTAAQSGYTTQTSYIEIIAEL
jgi:hypothetical protein